MIVGSIFSGLLNDVLSSFAQGFSQAASSFLTAIFQALNASTSLSLSGSNFTTEFSAVFEIGLLLTILLALIELGAAALARDAKRIARVPLNILLMVTGTIVSVTVINLLLGIADQLSVGLLHATGFTMSSTEMVVALAAIATEPATVLVMAGFIILACVAIYLALVARQVLVVVAAVLAPLAFSGMTSKWTHNWWRRWAEMLLGIIFSKVVLVIILITGFHVMAGLGATNVISAISSLIGGVGLLMAAAFAPLFSMKMMHFTGGQFANAAGLGHHLASAATDPVQKASKVGAAVATGGATAGLATATGLSHLGKKRGGEGGEPPSSGNGPRPSAPSSGGDNGPSDGGRGSEPKPSAPTTTSSSPSPAVATAARPVNERESAAPTAAPTTTSTSTPSSRSAPPHTAAAPVSEKESAAPTAAPTTSTQPVDSAPSPTKGGIASRVAKAAARARALHAGGTNASLPPSSVMTPRHDSGPERGAASDAQATPSRVDDNSLSSHPLTSGEEVRPNSLPSRPPDVAETLSAPLVPSPPAGGES